MRVSLNEIKGGERQEEHSQPHKKPDERVKPKGTEIRREFYKSCVSENTSKYIPGFEQKKSKEGIPHIYSTHEPTVL